MSTPQRRFRLAMLAASMAIAGCATPPPVDTGKLPLTPAAFAGGSWTVAPSARLPPAGEWWKVFNDAVLDGLVARAMERNDRIQVAASRLDQVRALARVTDARRLPLVGFGAGVSRGSDLSAEGEAATTLSAGLALSYEVDVFGRIARASEAARMDTEAHEALLRSAQLLIQAAVAQAYFSLRALDAEILIVQETVLAYAETLRVTQSRFRAGDVAELDVARVLTEKAAAESQALALQRDRAVLAHGLAVLVGEVASVFTLGPGRWEEEVPVVPAGVPATVLTRRPDVAAAQRQLLAAQARVGVVQAAWFPDLRLTASGGLAASSLSDVFRWSARAWGIGALLSLPVFDGRRDASVAAATAEMDAALYGYREQLLVAFREVEDQLSALRYLHGQAKAEASAVTSAQRATSLSSSRYRNGFVSQLELLDAQRNELRSRRMAIQVRSARFQATVRLIRALGGSWEPPSRPDPAG